MKIREMHIEGFGHFHDYTMRDLPPCLTIIKGPNEAGKSTLLAFIRRMLFGKPPGRSFNPYEPLNGGEYGGRLTVETGGGEVYDIVRQGKPDQYTIRDENGTPVMRPLESITGSADQYFYDNVFAFGLEELYRFETLSEDSVQNHVTGAGVGMKTCSVPVLQKTIIDEIHAFYKPGRSSKPRITKCMKEITDTKKAIRALSKSQMKYDEYQQNRRTVEAELSRLKALRSDILKEKENWKRIAGIWEDWTVYQEISGRLTALPVIDTFPEDGKHLLDRINERMQEREDARTGKERERQNILIDCSAITVNTAVLELGSGIRSLERGLGKYLSDVSSRDALAEELASGEDGYRRGLSLLNPDWDDAALLSFDSSPEAQSRVSGFRKEFSRYEEDLRILAKEVEQIRNDRDAVVPKCTVLQETLRASDGLPAEEKVLREKKAVDELYAEIPVLDRLKTDLERAEKEEAAAGERWKETNAALTGKMPLWPAGLMVAAGVLSVGLGVIGDSIFIGGGLMVLFFIAAGVYWSAVQKHESRRNDVYGGDSVNVSETAVLEWADLRRKKQDEVQAFSSRLTGLAQVAGFERVPSAASIAGRRDELERLLKAIAERANHVSALSQLEGELAGKNLQLEEKTAENNLTENSLSKLNAEWKTWLRSVSLPEEMLPDIVQELIPKAQQLVALLHSNRTKSDRLLALTTSAAEYESEVNSLMEECGVPSGGSVEEDIERLVSTLGENEANRKKKEDTALSCRKLENEILLLTEEIDTLLAEKTTLLTKGSSTDEDQFREYGRVWSEQRELNRDLESHKSAIVRAAGIDNSFDAYTAELETLEYGEVAGAVVDLEERLMETEESIEEQSTSLGQIRESIAQLEAEDESARLESEYRCLCDEVNIHSREWAKRVIAGYILGKAVERYEKERQPAVIREATDIFSDISDGRYRRIIKPLDANGVLVEEASGGRKEVSQLSRGTAEQLYLALRFGYITEFGKHDVALPVVFDDILVNFDPVRKENSCRAIARLAETNQVLYFTCHPDTAEMLRECCGDARVIDLGRESLEG
ncbi:AAA family ATPase [Methanogenium organophilum]|uniref:AAA family ATPase n=1 Tax=Methanogenium organophilum TaxID=2199 RepID=A0A9X9S2Y6_METOG|nr:AAA family ATPase [Methanogenium organophilum]WAI00532.1 AAA family ATPase [Methanogenium organophilum]